MDKVSINLFCDIILAIIAALEDHGVHIYHFSKFVEYTRELDENGIPKTISTTHKERFHIINSDGEEWIYPREEPSRA